MLLHKNDWISSVKPSTMCMNSLVPDFQKFPPWVIKKDKFCRNKILFMLQFGNCFPLPMKETTTLRVIFCYVYLRKTFIAPDGLINSAGTSSKTCCSQPSMIVVQSFH